MAENVFDKKEIIKLKLCYKNKNRYQWLNIKKLLTFNIILTLKKFLQLLDINITYL